MEQLEQFDEPHELYHHIRRQWTNNPYFNFFAGQHVINGPEDVAQIFQSLQMEAVEHFFAVHVRADKSFEVQWSSTGNIRATLVDKQQIIEGARHFNAEVVYLIHNHPSGNLKPSENDKLLTRDFRDILSAFNIRVEHIIINLDSGKFAWLNNEDNYYAEQQLPLPADSPTDAIPLTVHTFSRQVFKETYFPEVLRTPHQVAAYISSLRFGMGFKLGALLLNTRLTVVANYILPPYPYHLDDSFKDILTIAPRHGTVTVVLYGNLPISGALQNAFTRLQEKLQKSNLRLGDYIHFSTSNDLPVRREGYSYQSMQVELPQPNQHTQFAYDESPEYELNDDSIAGNFSRLETSLMELSKIIKTQETSERTQHRLSRFPGTGFAWGFIANHDFPESWKDYERKYHDSLFRIYDIIDNDLGLDAKQVQAVRTSFEKSAASAFFTPDVVADAIVSALKPHLPAKPSVLEPSAGGGAFIRAIQNNFEAFNIIAVEKDLLTSMILKHSFQHPDILIKNDGYEEAFTYLKPQFDLIVSNFPFGDYSVFDKKYATSKNPTLKASIRRIHNYFAVKSIELLPEDGILAFVTTNGFTNSVHNKPFREYLLSKADLICNIGLPNTLFKGSNTPVGTNLVVIKKNSTKEFLSQFEQSFVDNEHEYFFPAGDRSNIIATSVTMEKNQYGQTAPYYDYDKPLDELASELSKLIAKQFDNYKSIPQSKIPERVTRNFSNQVQLSLFDVHPSTLIGASGNASPSEHTAPADQQPKREKETFEVEPYSFYRQGWLVTDGKQVGEWCQEDNGIISKEDNKIRPITIDNGRLKHNLILLLQVRDSFLRLYYSESSNVTYINEEERQRLNELYTQFKKNTRSFINHPDCRALLRMSKQSSFFKNIERLGTDGQWHTTELFQRPIFLQKQPKDLSALDALAYSMNALGKVSLPLMSEISSLNETDLIAGLKGRIYFNPDLNDWEEKSFFLCGRIADKLSVCEKALAAITPDHPHYTFIEDSIEALKNTLPNPIPFEDISIQLGTVWLPVEYYSEFTQKLFKEDTIDIILLNSSNEFIVHPKDFSNSIVNTTYALKTESRLYNGLHILELTMNDDLPQITKCIKDHEGRKVHVLDVENTAIMKQKMEELRQLFYDYLLNLPREDKERIAAIYNDLYNAHVNFMADGSHLQLNDMHFFKDTIYPYQKNSAWHLIAHRGGIIDLQPGAGKSLIMFITAHEMKKMGLCRKPLIVCLKSNVVQMVAMYRLTYPNDNIIYPNEKDFATKNRENILYQIANNDWDCVFLTQEQFSEIPPTPEIEEAIIHMELATLKSDLKALDTENAPKRKFKELQKKQENLQNRLRLAMERIIRKKDTYTYDRLGIDKLFVDESHYYKNLGFSTRHSQLSGIGNPMGSQRAFNLLIAIRTHQILHASSITMPQWRDGIPEPHTLVPQRDYGASLLSGTTITNSISEMFLLFKYMIPRRLEKMKIASFDAWSKVFALKTTEYEFSVTTEFKQKTRLGTFFNVPELSALYRSVAFYIPPSELQIDKPQCVLRQVVIQQTPEQAAMTQRLIRFAKSGEPSILGLYHLSKKQARECKMLICTDYGKKMTLDMRMVTPTSADHPGNKLSICAANIAEYYKKYNDHKGTQLVFLDIGTPGSNFDAYAELKRKLVNDHLIPAHEIAFVHDATNDAQRDALFDRVNKGEIRVIIGSTRKLATGVNCQHRVVAMHSLDITWTPAEMDQRAARGARQGNILAPLYLGNKVEHFIYCTEKSLDIFRFQLLAIKQNFIDQVKDNRVGLRVISELNFDDTSSLSYGQFIATLTGNPLLIESQKLMMNIAQLEMQRRAFYSEQYRIRGKHDWLIEELAQNKLSLARFENDKAFLEKAPVPVIKDKKLYTFILEGKTYQDIEDFGAHLKHKALDPTFAPLTPTVIGHFRGWDITAHHKTLSMTRPGGHFTYNYSFDFKENDHYNCGRYPIHCLQRIDGLVTKFKEKVVQNEKDIALLNVATTVKAWPKENELSEMKERKQQIEVEIELSERKDNSTSQDDTNAPAVDAAVVPTKKR